MIRDDLQAAVAQPRALLPAIPVGFDPLTGALVRDRLHDEIVRAAAAAARSGEPAAVCVVGLDNLREINAVHGHAMGDALLAAVATAISSRLRATDALGRLGADEFAVV